MLSLLLLLLCALRAVCRHGDTCSHSATLRRPPSLLRCTTVERCSKTQYRSRDRSRKGLALHRTAAHAGCGTAAAQHAPLTVCERGWCAMGTKIYG
jgi:hypothetical protein